MERNFPNRAHTSGQKFERKPVYVLSSNTALLRVFSFVCKKKGNIRINVTLRLVLAAIVALEKL
jgi:hypothetical protein